MLLVVEWYFNDLQNNLQMTVSLEVIFSFLDGNPKFSSQRTTLTSICAVAKAEARMSVSTLESSHLKKKKLNCNRIAKFILTALLCSSENVCDLSNA